MNDFEKYLQEVCFNENPQVLDDDTPDFFDAWIGDVQIDDMIEHANNFADTIKNKESQQHKIEREIFEMVYTWGRVGLVVDESCNTYQSKIKELINLTKTNE